MAKKNALLHHTEIHFIQQDYLNSHLPEVFDVIISNPPYIGTEEEIDIENSVKDFEPMMALFAPENDVLAFYRKIANDTETSLSDEGLFLEINQNWDQKHWNYIKINYPKHTY